MSKPYIARGETLPLNNDTRAWMRGSFVRLGDGVTHYELTGPDDGPLVLLLGTLTAPLFYWDEVVAGLHRRGLRTLTYSAYGRGYSDRLPGPYDGDLFTRQALQLLDAVAPNGPVHVVGSSMGALTALLLVDREPGRVASLTLLGPAGLGGGPPLPVRLATGRRLGRALGRPLGRRFLRAHLAHNVSTPAQVARLSAMVTDTYRCQGSVHALLSTLAHLPLHGQEEVYRRAGRHGVPTLLIRGRTDQVTPIRELPRVLDLLRPQRHRIIDGGHMVPFEHPGLTVSEITSFHEEICAPRP
ncbi:alpha/beta fold hydrolase [Streptomyces sp. NPDC059479]|uniref:alpha/beta fold hydrolase n=1 Tax=Streptomyces sp. NPDC059479 TaxID=3346848 RepID=UPI00367DFA56